MGKSLLLYGKPSIHSDVLRQLIKHKFQHPLSLLPQHQELNREWNEAQKYSAAPTGLAMDALSTEANCLLYVTYNTASERSYIPCI